MSETAQASRPKSPACTPDFSALPDRELAALAETYRELDRLTSHNRIDGYYPDAGPFRRELYAKHMEFFRLGAQHKERLFMAGNRTGKSVAGAYEITCHLRGVYPAWWEGRRFTAEPVNALVAGDTAKTSRDILQHKLLGPVGSFGTGMIPYDSLERVAPKQGIPDAVETIYVRHVSGALSTCQINSYDQGREAFQGTERHVIWLDEECPEDVYTESLMRTMTTDGIVLLTFTPIRGITPLVLSFLPDWVPQ